MRRSTDIPSFTERGLQEARTLLLEDERFLRRKVCAVARENELQDKRVEAVFSLAAGHLFHWSPQDWQVVTDSLYGCQLTVGEWLDAHRRTT